MHLVYFVGDPAGGDLRYVRSQDGAKTFPPSLAVNTRPGSAIALGNVRGAQIAIGKNGRVHVVWNGVLAKEPGSANATGRPSEPMSYTRLRDDGGCFEPERDMIATHHGLDGGGAVAADAGGNVWVVWHAPDEHGEGEEARRVWVAHSSDEGESFDPEMAASQPGTGVCPCCGLGAIARDGGGLAILYRMAEKRENRHTVLLSQTQRAEPFDARSIDPWKVPT